MVQFTEERSSQKISGNPSSGQRVLFTESLPNQQQGRNRRVELPPIKSVPTAISYNPPSVKVKAATNNSRSIGVTSPQSLKKRNLRKQRQRQQFAAVLWVVRLLILGVGISAIAGTLLSILDPTTRIAKDGSKVTTAQLTTVQAPEKMAVATVPPSALKLTGEIIPLKTIVQQLVSKNPKLTPGILFVDLDTGAYLDINGSATVSAASTIKVPVLVAFFQDVDAGKIRLNEMLTLKKELIGGGSGEMQYKPIGTKYTALETATKMITISDNTATNMLIERLGGIAAVNQRFQSWGLTATNIHNPLPDLPGTNLTSPKDLAHLMALVNQGELITLKSRDRLLAIMRQTKTNTLLPQGLGAGATIAHKTGDIGSVVGDVGLVDMPSGKRYVAVALVKRPHNNSEAKELIRQVSRAAYQQFNQPVVVPTAVPTVVPSPSAPLKPFITTVPER